MTDSDLRLKKGIKLNLILLFSAFTFYFLVYYLVNKTASTRYISFYCVLAGFSFLNVILVHDFIVHFSRNVFKIISAVFSVFIVIFLIYLLADNVFKINIISVLRSYRKWIYASYFMLSLIQFLNYAVRLYVSEKRKDDNSFYSIPAESRRFFKASAKGEAAKVQKTGLSGDGITGTAYNIFRSSVFYTAAVLLVYSPAAIYLTSPADFHLSAILLLVSGTSAAAAFYAASVLIYRQVPLFFKYILLYSSVFISLIIFTNTFIIPGQYGSLNNLILSDAEKLYGSVFPYFREFLLITALYAASVFLVRKAGKKAAPVLLLINLVAFAQTGMGLVSYRSSGNTAGSVSSADEKGFLPSYNDDLMSFSKDGKNIVVLFLDMFSGGYVQDIFKERPDLKEVYDGFTWYPNTLSISYVTSSSVPSMLAGWDYAPDAINSFNEGRPLSDVIGDSYLVLPALLEKHNYKTSYLDPEYCYTYRGDIEKLESHGITAGFNKDYIGYWKNKNRFHEDDNINKGGQKLFELKLLAMISLFKASPAVVKPVVYNGGDWLVVNSTEKTNSAYRSKMEYWSFFDSLSEISNTESEKNTFKFLHTSLTHDPFSLSGDGELVKGYPDPEAGDNFHGKNAYLSAKGALVALERWISWFKENEIYDNSKIIIVTDHGDDFSTSPMMKENFNVEGITDEDFTRLHAVLMIKDFGSRGELNTDWRFMSNADLPAIIVSDYPDIDVFGPDMTKTENPGKRVLKAMKADSWRWHHVSKYEKFSFEYFYEVEDNLFEAENWKKK